MDLTTFLLSLGITLGLIGSDAYLNSNTLYLEANVANEIVDKGYSKQVVADRLVNQIKRMSRTRSLVSAPGFHSSRSKSFAVALAQAASLESAMVALQDLFGYVPPSMQATVVSKGDNVEIVVSGFSDDAGYLEASADGTADNMETLFHDAAIAVILKVDPYTGILHHLERHAEDKRYRKAIAWIEEAIDKQPATPRNNQRAYLENLRGIVALLDGDDMAEVYFTRSVNSKPDFAVAWLNLAFTLVQQGRYQDAIDVAERVTRPWWWAMTADRKVLASAQILIGAARSRLDDDAGAVAAYREALRLNPRSAEAYAYWGRLLIDQGDKDEAERKFNRSEQNAAYFNNYPEVAMLYFWVPEQAGERLIPRPNLIDRLNLETGMESMMLPMKPDTMPTN